MQLVRAFPPCHQISRHKITNANFLLFCNAERAAACKQPDIRLYIAVSYWYSLSNAKTSKQSNMSKQFRIGAWRRTTCSCRCCVSPQTTSWWSVKEMYRSIQLSATQINIMRNLPSWLPRAEKVPWRSRKKWYPWFVQAREHNCKKVRLINYWCQSRASCRNCTYRVGIMWL
jgi:hypothetical protein